jgi:hypothetical protein
LVEGAARWTGGAGPAPAAHLDVPWLCDALAAVEDPEPGLRLVSTVRPMAAMNHWLRAGRAVVNAHPDDVPPGPAVLRGPGGELEVEVVADPELARGTVVVPYGDPACNPNELVGTDVLEPCTGQPLSNGTVIEVLESR